MSANYTLRVLRVDLSRGSTTVEDIDGSVVRKYIGGAGLAAKILWDETTKDTEALAPESPLIFMLGPLTGTNMPMSSRYVVAGISPMTGIWGEAHSGGDFGDELRHSGFDGIVVKGQAKQPVYLWLHNGKAEIRDASHLWGKDTYETEALIKAETDDKACVAHIGPAGEKQVKLACVMNDGRKGRAAARCGLGALMGSKKLKAIAARGTQEIKLFDEKKFKENVAAIYKFSPPTRHEDMVEKEVENAKDMLRSGSFPVKNWSEGTYEFGFHMADDLRNSTGMYCRHCPYSHQESKWTADGKERVAVWEAVGPIGGGCLLENAEAIQTAYSICNRYGMDAISVGDMVSFAIECYEKGLITKKDTGGVELTWGNHEAVVEMVRQIGEKEGFGALLGEGMKASVDHIGPMSAEYAVHVKGLPFAMHDPRAAFSTALGYATCNIGADHSETAFARCYEVGYFKRDVGRTLPELGILEMIDRHENKGKGILSAKSQDVVNLLNSLVICRQLTVIKRVPPSLLLELLNAVTGWDMDLAEYMKAGERTFNLKRMFNVIRGISRKDDILPPRILSHPRGSGGSADAIPHIGLMLHEFYNYRGWSEEGIPTNEKLKELGLLYRGKVRT